MSTFELPIREVARSAPAALKCILCQGKLDPNRKSGWPNFRKDFTIYTTLRTTRIPRKTLEARGSDQVCPPCTVILAIFGDVWAPALKSLVPDYAVAELCWTVKVDFSVNQPVLTTTLMEPRHVRGLYHITGRLFVNGADTHNCGLASHGSFARGRDQILDLAVQLAKNCRLLHTHTAGDEGADKKDDDGHRPGKQVKKFDCSAVKDTEARRFRYPVTLIDLRDQPLRLVDFKPENPFPHQYVALSHHRFYSQTLETIKFNVEAHHHALPLHRLSATVNDAIRVCRRLGIPFLWIDSLCIIQDSYKDWLQQASQMWAIYNNAEIVIGAARDSCDGQGLLGPRCPWPAMSVSVQSPCRDQASLPLVFRLGRNHADNTRLLEERGWTFQERLAARRYLVFGSAEVSWLCRQKTWCECGRGIGDVDKWKLLHPEDQKEDKDTDPYLLWAEYVTTRFSGTELSRHEDVLVAISGAAAHHQATHGGNYLAGLWKEDLLRGLAWVTALPLQAQRFYMPTWTWTSVRGRTYPFQREVLTSSTLTELVSITGASTTPTTINPFGPVVDGEIMLEGTLLEFDAQLVVSGDGLILTGPGDVTDDTLATYLTGKGRIRVAIDTYLVGRTVSVDGSRKLTVRRQRPHKFEEALEYKDGLTFSVWLLPLFIGYVDDPKDRTSSHFHALILVPSEKKPGCFERIGLCTQVMIREMWQKENFECRLVDAGRKDKIMLV